MKSLQNFEAFKMNKVQMNAIAGGKILCNVYYEDGGSYVRVISQEGVTPSEAKEVVQEQAPDAKVSCYYA